MSAPGDSSSGRRSWRPRGRYRAAARPSPRRRREAPRLPPRVPRGAPRQGRPRHDRSVWRAHSRTVPRTWGTARPAARGRRDDGAPHGGGDRGSAAVRARSVRPPSRRLRRSAPHERWSPRWCHASTAHTEQLVFEASGAVDLLSRTARSEQDSSRGAVARHLAARFSSVTARSTLRTRRGSRWLCSGAAWARSQWANR